MGVIEHGDRIEVRGLRVYGKHGVHESERLEDQPFEIDLDMFVDTARAAQSDELDDTADYSAAVGAAAGVVAGPPHRLLESLAAEIAAGVLEDRRVKSVTVSVRKLRPPLPYEIRSAGVRLSRSL